MCLIHCVCVHVMTLGGEKGGTGREVEDCRNKGTEMVTRQRQIHWRVVQTESKLI